MTTKQITAKGLAGILAEVAAVASLGIKGRVELELVDDRTGRVVDRRSADNYINTTQWERFAKYIQRTAWSWALSPATITATDKGRDPRVAPTLRNDTLACWADATAEDTTDLYAFGEVVAWAHRWSQGSPSIRQGIVNPPLCTISEDAVSWVWEWATTNGNGTFQSVGWRRLWWSAAAGDPILFDSPNFSRRLTTNTGFVAAPGTPLINVYLAVAAANIGTNGTYYNTADGKLYQVQLVTASNASRLVACPVTIDPTTGNYLLGTCTDESANVIAAALGGDNVATTTRRTFSMTRLGASGDWIMVGLTGTTSAQRPTIRRGTPAGAVTYTNANAATFTVASTFVDVTYDGTNLWALAWSAGASRIYRIDPATGTISATIAAIVGMPAYAPSTFDTTSTYMSGIEWDPVLSCLWVTTTSGYIFNIDTSGNWLGVLMSWLAHSDVVTSTPQSGTVSGGSNILRRRPADVDAFYTNYGAVIGSTLTDPFAQTLTTDLDFFPPPATARDTKLFTMDGDIWMTLCSPIGSNLDSVIWTAGAFTQEPNFASRTDLGSPVVKANTQTMRIRYTMTFT